MRAGLSLGYVSDVVAALIGRELKLRYKGSLLGLLWALLNPLGTVVILHFLFTKVMPLHIPHYAAFIYCALLPWSWFQVSLQSSASTLFDNRDLVRKPFFPRHLLPAVVTGTNFILYLLALPVLVGLMLWDGLPFPAAIVFLPLVWLVQGVLTLGIAVIFSGLGVLIRDLQHLLGVGMLLWFYLTPVFYDLSRVDPVYARLLGFNPMTAMVQATRAIVIEGRPPDLGLLFLWLGVGALLLAGGLLFFHFLEDVFIEEV